MHIIDLDKHLYRLGTPETSAFENDYNTVQGDLAPDALENCFMAFETSTSHSWHKMIRTDEIPSDPDDLNNILNFVAVQTLRTPPNRKIISDLAQRTYQAVARELLNSPRMFANTIERARLSGVDMPTLPEGVSLEDVYQTLLTSNFDLNVSIPNGYYIDLMTKQVGALLHNLRQRSWVVYATRDSASSIITSDDPVTVVALTTGKSSKPVGFGSANTVVVVPLSPRLVLLGLNSPMSLSPKSEGAMVEEINRVTHEQSFRFLYSHSREASFYFPFNEPSRRSPHAEAPHPQQDIRVSTERNYTIEFGDMIIVQSPTPTSVLNPALFF